jgi:Flp pilus assembly protein TadD
VNGRTAAGRAEEAVEAFRNALAFGREDRAMTLSLAHGLAASGRPGEARAYLLTLRDEQPGNGEVNLALARLESARHDVTAAMRYYHYAIEGAWPEGAERRRRATRLELAAFLVHERSVVQAQAELIALAGDLPQDRSERLRIAGLMRDAGLHAQALVVYGGLLGEQPDDELALAGAGEAAFAAGNYRGAVAYFTRASRGGLLPADSADRLATARLVVAGDPLQPRLTGLERRRRTLRALAAAVARLDGCAAQPGTAASLQEVTADAATLRDRVTARTLARDPDLMELALSLVWRIELQTAEVCGAPGGIDAALLLVARRRQGASP